MLRLFGERRFESRVEYGHLRVRVDLRGGMIGCMIFRLWITSYLTTMMYPGESGFKIQYSHLEHPHTARKHARRTFEKLLEILPVGERTKVWNFCIIYKDLIETSTAPCYLTGRWGDTIQERHGSRRTVPTRIELYVPIRLQRAWLFLTRTVSINGTIGEPGMPGVICAERGSGGLDVVATAAIYRGSRENA